MHPPLYIYFEMFYLSGTEADHLRSLLLSLLTSEAMDQFQIVIERLGI